MARMSKINSFQTITSRVDTSLSVNESDFDFSAPSLAFFGPIVKNERNKDKVERNQTYVSHERCGIV